MNYNPNNAIRDRFILSIPNHSDVALKVLSSPVPDISIDGISIRGSNDPLMAHLDGDTITYAPASWMFIVDEDLENYYKLFKWMVDNTTKQTDKREDGTMSILDASGTKVLRRITYEDLHPISLGEISYGTDDASSTTLTCTVTMRYTRFDVVKPNAVPYTVIPNVFDTTLASKAITSVTTNANPAAGTPTVSVTMSGGDPNVTYSVNSQGFVEVNVNSNDAVPSGSFLMENGSLVVDTTPSQ